MKRLLKQIWNYRQLTAVRYALPFLSVAAAFGTQLALDRILPKQFHFPSVILYLAAFFVSAWFGGYIPGVIACLATLVGLPAIFTPGFRVTSIAMEQVTLVVILSLAVSLVAQALRRRRAALIHVDEMDRRVQERTEELAQAVEALTAEVERHKRTEEALRESEQRVDLALDAAGIGQWHVDLITGEVIKSGRHQQILGQGAARHAGTRAELFANVVSEDRPGVEARFQKALDTAGVCEFECRVQQSDGAVRWVWARGRVLSDEHGHPLRFLGSSRDITDRKLAEHKLQSQLQRMNLLGQITRAIGERQDLRSIFQVVIRSLEDNLPLDFACLCLYDAAAEQIHVTSVGLHGEGVAMELAMTENAHIDIDQNGLSQCLRGRVVYEADVSAIDFPFPQRLARGGLRALVGAPLLFESQVFGILLAARREPNSFSSGECEFLQQLSEHVALAAHQAETHTALQQAYDDLRQTQQSVMQQERLRALGQMASGIAHDINNAISPVALYTEMLLEQEPGLSKRTRDYLETTQRAIGDVAHTVARMREFYRRQEPELVLSPVDLSVLVQQVIDLTRARWHDIPQKRGVVIDLRPELPGNLPAVAGVESEIREALINLVFNAVDAMPEGGTLSIRTRTVEVRDKQDREVLIEVADTGIGMDDDTRRRCLEPFFTTKGERGTGLGLAMVYGVVRRHNAEIEMESTVGEGTTVRVRFPVAAPQTAGAQSLGREVMPPRLRILSVDDDPLLIKSLRDALEGDGHAVVTASGGQEGIEIFRAAAQGDERFAVVITDLGMPYVDGRKVASAIKNESPSTPVILLTGWGQRLVAEGDVPPNVDRVLNKPPKLRELRTALAELMHATLSAPVA